jgi:hypothetical protein
MRKSPYFHLSQIPANARGFRAHNGIVAKLYHYMTNSRAFQRIPQAISVPVPYTTLPEAFRIYILHYLRKRKLSVNTSLRKLSTGTEVLVWLRGDGRAARQSEPISFQKQLELAPLWPPGKVWEYEDDSVDDDGTPIIYV